MTRHAFRWRPRLSGAVAAVVVASLFSLDAVSLAAQTGTIEGKVTAVNSGEPIAGAEVAIPGLNLGARAGADGSFKLLNVPVGLRELRILAIGYKVVTLRLTVSADSASTVTVQLAPSLLQLDAVVVTGTAGQARASAASHAKRSAVAPAYVPGEVVVGFATAPSQTAAARLRTLGVRSAVG